MKKHIFITALFCFVFVTPCFAANKYLSAATGTGNWSDATGTWVTASGGTTPIAAPTTADVCYMDAGSSGRTINVDATTNVCGQLITTGFTGTINSTNAANILTITTNITISATTNFGATAFRLKAGAGTATWNFGVTFPWDFEMAGTGAKTLSANVTIGGITYVSTNPTSVNGYNWYAVGGCESTVAGAQRGMVGTTVLYVQGGNYKYFLKGTGGKLIFDGNVNIQGGTVSTSGPGIRDTTFEYLSGTITSDPDVIFIFAGTNTVSVGSNVVFEQLDAAGKTTLTADLYVAHSLQVAGMQTMTWAGAYTIHVGYGGGAAHLIMYNKGTNISTTTKISFEGTGSIFRKTSLNGMAYEAVNPWQCDLEINTPGTATFDPITTGNKWANSGTLTYISGTVVTTGCNWIVTGAYNFDGPFTVPTLTIGVNGGSGGVAGAILKDFTCTTYRQYSNTGFSIYPGATLFVTTYLYINGTDNLNTINQCSGAGVAKWTYQGTAANVQMYDVTFQNIDASDSTVPLYLWYGSATGCTNIFAKTGDNIKTLAYASA